MERVVGGLKIGATWSNSAGTDLKVSGYSAPYIDFPLPVGHGALDKIGCLGFNLMSNDLFTNGTAGGTYRVSNLALDYVTPPAFSITRISHNAMTQTLTITWISDPGSTYDVEFSTAIAPAGWGPYPGQTGIASQGTSTSVTFADFDSGFYRIRKL